MRVALAAAAVVLAAVAVSAEQWPEFRGPTAQGHSDARGLPADWSEAQNVAWKAPVPGLGWSSPVVSDGLVWLTTATGANPVSLRALAFDAATGRQVIDVEVFSLARHGEISPKNSFASPTPIVRGDRVFVHFGMYGTAALAPDGRVLWKTQLPYASQHGGGGSPLLYDNLLIVSCDGHDAAYVVALDVETGKVRWKTPRRQPADQAYTTPLLIRVAEQDQLISVGAYRAYAYEPRTGAEIWHVRYDDGFSNVPRPVFAHGLVIIATGFGRPSIIAVRPDGRGDITRTHIAWTVHRGVPFTPSPIAVGDELYLLADAGVLSCLDIRTGAAHWQKRLPGTFSASPVFADGKIILLSEQGTATMIAPGRSFQLIGTSTVAGGTLASLAVADRAIFIRSETHLYRIGTAPEAVGGAAATARQQRK